MSLPGSGLIRASCSAYRNTNGVPMPGVSPGSRKVGAIEASKAIVNWPSGWACAAASPVDVPNASRNRSATDAVSLLMSSLHVVLEQLERPENRTRTRHVRRRSRSCATAATKSVTLMGLLWYPPGDRWPTSPLPSRASARNSRRPLVITEGAGRRAHLGGEALREVTRVLAIEGIAE